MRGNTKREGWKEVIWLSLCQGWMQF
jgi:hypothetical protein